MSGWDKQTLKILKTRQYTDLSASDIAVALECDKDSAQESLNSLKDQGRDGKLFWRLFSNEPHGNSNDINSSVVTGNKNSTETNSFFVDFNPNAPTQIMRNPLKEKATQENSASDTDSFLVGFNPFGQTQIIKRPVGITTEKKPQEKISAATEEFLINPLAESPIETRQNPIDLKTDKKPAEKGNSETEEFYMNLLSEKPGPAPKEQVLPKPEPMRREKNSPETEGYYSTLLSKKPKTEPEKKTDAKPQKKFQERKHSDTEEFYIDLLSENSKVTLDQMIDDDTRSWNVPPEAITKGKTIHDSGFIKEKINAPDKDFNPPKRAQSPILWIIISICASVLISTGITIVMMANFTKAANADLQALSSTINVLITEESTKRDQRMEMLTQKIIALKEKIDDAQKPLIKDKADGLQKPLKMRGKIRPKNHP
jgi:hypothetical protein